MTCPDYIQTALTSLQYCTEIEGSGIVVATHCLYGDGGVVNVIVNKLGDEYTVSDGGGAFECLADYSRAPKNWDKFLKRFGKDYGLTAKNCEIVTPVPVSSNNLPAAIIFVANASKDAADAGLTVLKVERLKRFKEIFHDFVDRRFSSTEVRKDFRLVGESNKSHSFDFAINMHNGLTLITDAVVHDPNSINAKVVSHLDIANANLDGVVQRIVFDDRDKWESANLHLLKMSATTVPYSMADSEFQKIIARSPQ